MNILENIKIQIFFLYHEFITKKQTIKYILLFCKDMYNNIGATSTENVSL